MMGIVGILMFFLIGLCSLCGLVFWIWSLVDCLTRRDETLDPMFGSVNPKLVWALLIFFTGVIGSIIYLFVAGTKNSPRRAVVQTRTAGTEESRRILDMVTAGKITAAEGQRLLAALETKEQQAASAQMRSATPRGARVGCLLVILLILVLLGGLVAFGLLFACHRRPEPARLPPQVEQQIRERLDGGFPGTVHSSRTVRF